MSQSSPASPAPTASPGGGSTPSGSSAPGSTAPAPGSPAAVEAAKVAKEAVTNIVNGIATQGQIHSYSVAYWWGAAFFAFGAILTVLLYRRKGQGLSLANAHQGADPAGSGEAAGPAEPSGPAGAPDSRAPEPSELPEPAGSESVADR